MIVGITTAPRQQSTLVRSMRSIARAGWDRQVVFAEPSGVPLLGEVDEIEFDVVASDGERVVGPCLNFCRAANTLKEQRGDYVLIFQDDVHVTRGARDYLERCWPEADIVSLYCSKANHRGCIGGFHASHRSANSRYGALAVAMRQHVAEAMGNNPFRARYGDAALDIRLAKWADSRGFVMATHSPSLVRHTGFTSTLGEGKPLNGNRQCADFLEDVRMLAGGTV